MGDMWTRPGLMQLLFRRTAQWLAPEFELPTGSHRAILLLRNDWLSLLIGALL